ncbi:LysR substrate-binding domain-containing protein [Paraburkholderia sp. BCC1885]|uniref:LysR substrate-binding domain-containing protein n=1 Tax=Paraburkholderia sp. BCC1885 TaxID=2562669 RepID=UPI0011834606|nr:LysR substrate-binding domain-containing protein [Paraburkholderia sp. BCC1885]
MTTSRFDLIDMRLFLMAVEHGSLTRGAQAMHLALASASERISGMESALGTPLLERTRRGVRTTAAGDALVRHARLILGQVEQMRGELRTYASGLKGRIRLLSNTAALAAFLPEQLCRFLATHPDLSVDLDERPSAEIVLAIAEGRADLGIVADIADLAALQTHLVAEDQLVVVASNGHRVSAQSSVAFADIVHESFVGLSDAALQTHLADRASRLGHHLDYRVRLRNVADVGRLVEAGIGIAILPEVCAVELHRSRLVVLPLSETWASRRLHLCARDFAALAPHAHLLAHQLMASIESRGSGVATD